MNEILTALGLKNATAVAGGVGALISFKFFKELAWPERVYTAVLSIPVAGYGSGALTEAFALGPRTELAAMVLIAAVGIAVLSALFKTLPAAIPVWVESARKAIFKGE